MKDKKEKEREFKIMKDLSYIRSMIGKKKKKKSK